MHPWHDIKLPVRVREPVPVVIESPAGSRVRYELDRGSGLLFAERVFFSSAHCPANYGFVPRTCTASGRPLDIVVYCKAAIQPLAIMRARVIGVIRVDDGESEAEKLISVHADDPEYAEVRDLGDLPPHRMRELRRFFHDFRSSDDTTITVSEPKGRREALDTLRQAIERYRELQKG